jgi:hypothetical protein
MKYEDLKWVKVEGSAYEQSTLDIDGSKVKIVKFDDDSYQIFVNDVFTSESDFNNLLKYVEMSSHKYDVTEFNDLKWEEYTHENVTYSFALFNKAEANKKYAIITHVDWKDEYEIYETHENISGAIGNSWFKTYEGKFNLYSVKEFMKEVFVIPDLSLTDSEDFEAATDILIKEFDLLFKNSKEVVIPYLPSDYDKMKIIKLKEDSYNICVIGNNNPENRSVELDKKFALVNFAVSKNGHHLMPTIIQKHS